MASSLPVPDELVQEILVRLPTDEPVHLVRASVVCKAWRRILCDRDCFLRRCHGFHGAPPLLGYIQNRHDATAMKFVPATTFVASAIRMPEVDYSSCVALDCHHGRVLIHYNDQIKRKLIVWDPITGSQQHLRLPYARYPSYSSHDYTGAVLCAKDGCDHLDCHDGPFSVVLVETNLHGPILACVASYSSLTGKWNGPTPYNTTHNDDYCFGGSRKPSLLIGKAIYFPFQYATSILKYDFCTHWLSEINMPRGMSMSVLMKTEDGGLGLATVSDVDNCIHIWSRQDVTIDIDGVWVEDRVIEFGTLLPVRYVPYLSYQVVGFAEGTNTIFINISTEIFTLDLKSKELRKFGEREDKRFDFILPYTSFYIPRI